MIECLTVLSSRECEIISFIATTISKCKFSAFLSKSMEYIIFFCNTLLAFDNACSNVIFVIISINILIKRAAARAYVPTAAKRLSATPYGIMRHTDKLNINLIT